MLPSLCGPALAHKSLASDESSDNLPGGHLHLTLPLKFLEDHEFSSTRLKIQCCDVNGISLQKKGNELTMAHYQEKKVS